MEPKPPTTAAVFQIPNSADEGTPDSTNLVVMTFELDSPEAVAAATRVTNKMRTESKPAPSHGSWQTYTKQDRQDATEYRIRDARRELADVVVTIRLAWPHLKQNPADYDEQMEKLFLLLLDGVIGELGPKPPREGEVIRRPLPK